ncbi:MAG: phosphate ABC transporter permease subunit PstC, partial [Dehalococcoidia bacterium]
MAAAAGVAATTTTVSRVTPVIPARLRTPLSALVELLAAIPSVVYGLWGTFVLVPFLRTAIEPFLHNMLGFIPLFSGPKIGIGLLAGGVIRAIIILTTVTAISRDVTRAVPPQQREVALALGETIAVTMVVGARPQ